MIIICVNFRDNKGRFVKKQDIIFIKIWIMMIHDYITDKRM